MVLPLFSVFEYEKLKERLAGSNGIGTGLAMFILALLTLKFLVTERTSAMFFNESRLVPVYESSTSSSRRSVSNGL